MPFPRIALQAASCHAPLDLAVSDPIGFGDVDGMDPLVRLSAA
jgi:hypothetical protein